MGSVKNLSLSVVLALAVLACSPSSSSSPGGQNQNNDTPSGFVTPNPTPDQIQAIMAKYSYVDPTQTIPPNLLQDALIYYDTNLALLGNPNVLSICDFSAYNGTQRFHVINMKTGAVTSTYVAHGMGSDPNWTGYATVFSNTENSDQSSLGFFLTAETYQGDNGYSERIDGLSPTNSNARDRDIVIHSASYVNDTPTKQGRSDGCFAFSEADGTNMINTLVGGSLIYAGLGAATATPAFPSAAGTVSPMPWPALWETSVHPERVQWSVDAYNAIATYGAGLLKGSADITSFCPKYASLTQNQQITFWVNLVSTVANYESSFNPTARYVETSLGIDPITGQTVVSEGLLQLSYQDVLTYPFCNQFDWSTDQSLNPEDPSKTIFDINKNLTCGIQILNQQVSQANAIAAPGYWSTLFPSGTNVNSKVTQIEALTKQISFCN